MARQRSTQDPLTQEPFYFFSDTHQIVSTQFPLELAGYPSKTILVATVAAIDCHLVYNVRSVSDYFLGDLVCS